MRSALKHEAAFNALGDATRRNIFEKLQHGPLSVAHIAEGIDVSRPAVSQHLKVLRKAKLITMTRQGTRSIYAIDQQGIRAMRDYLDRFWDQALTNFKHLAEKEEKKEEAKKPKK